MAVFRIEKTRDYTVMSNHHLRDTELSLKAKGLLSQMLSLPDDWDYTLAGLSHINKESIDAIRTAIWELERAGYIIRQQGRDAKGKMTAIEYTIFEKPQLPQPMLDCPMLENPTPGKPILENPIPDNPTSENPMQLNKDISSNYQQNTDLSNTDESNPILSNPPTPTGSRMGKDGMESREIYRQIILENIDYEILAADPQVDREQLYEITEIILDAVCTSRKTVRISSDDFPAEVVKSRFLKLNASHIQYVMSCMKENTTRIRNIKKYLLAALYNATFTMGSYYSALVQHDMAADGQGRRY